LLSYAVSGETGSRDHRKIQAGMKMEKHNINGYELHMWHSREDACYVASVPKLPGCMAHGDSQSECFREAAAAIYGWLSLAKKLNRQIPTQDVALSFSSVS
jgi:predicted RNase H-like HicB family nuclease